MRHETESVIDAVAQHRRNIPPSPSSTAKCTAFSMAPARPGGRQHLEFAANNTEELRLEVERLRTFLKGAEAQPDLAPFLKRTLIFSSPRRPRSTLRSPQASGEITQLAKSWR